jgi:hypothetical protein
MSYQSNIKEKAFKKMNMARRRVAIAKDVIQRMDNSLIIPMTGDIFGENAPEDYENSRLSLQEFFNSEPCEACAKGALVCSWVGNFNNYEDLVGFTFDFERHQGKNHTSYPKELIKIFGLEMLGLIEIAFEGNGNDWNVLGIRDPYLSGEYINTDYKNDLRGIMENIIKNKGEFVFDWKVA